MSAGFFIRSAGERDLAAVRGLLVETWHATYDGIYGAARVTAITDDWHSIAALRRRLTVPRSEFIVADDGQQVGGMAFAQADENDVATLRQLYVRPALQGQGIGTHLLAEVEGSFPEARSFELEVDERNGPARRFYGRRGFKACRSITGNDGHAVLTLHKPLGMLPALPS